MLKLAFTLIALNTVAPSVIICAEPEKQVVKKEEEKPSADSILLSYFLIGCAAYCVCSLTESLILAAFRKPSAYEQKQRIRELAAALQLAQTPAYLWSDL